MVKHAIAVSGLGIRYGARAIIENLDLHVATGEAVALLGRSGSGKTTILNCALGLLAPSAGTVMVLGQDVSKMNRRQAATFRADHIGIVFQHYELLLELTAAENVALPLMLSHRGARQEPAIERARTLLDSFDVDPEAPTIRLSGGEKQRVALARAMVNEPEIILADEPTGSLDTELRDEAADMLFEQSRARGATLVIVTHDPELATLADRRVRIEQGRITQLAP